MTRLDDVRNMQAIDRSAMYDHIAALPEQFEIVWREAKYVAIPTHYIQANNIVVLGMGGSAIGGSLVRSLLATQGDHKQFHIVRDYQVPQFVDRSSLVIGVSYSGNTEETLSAFEQAASKGAKLIAITSGGELERLATRHRAPIFPISYVSPPRAAISFLFVPLLLITTRLGLINFGDADMAQVTHSMAELRNRLSNDIPASGNHAKLLAQKMSEKIVATVGSGALAEVARRWKTQINENAKQASFFEVMPELCHNTIVGLDYPKTQRKEMFAVLLQSSFDHPRNNIRMGLFAAALARKGISYELIKIDNAPNPVAEIGQAVLLGDFVSYYLAILNGVDPTPVEAIDQLKKELTRH